MNMNNSPTLRDFQNLIAFVDDESGNHILWVAHNGEVHLDVFSGIPREAKFRFEAFMAGNGYVGPEASNDMEWMIRLFKALKECWEKGTTGFVDYF